MLENEIMLSIHKHPVKLTISHHSWWCDSLTDSPDKICEMGHS